MTDAAAALANLAVTKSAASLEFVIMQVDSIRDDGTVNLVQGGAVYLGVPCLESYLSRGVGDAVVVARWQAGWLVMGKVAAAWTPGSTGGGSSISWGPSAPGSGWVTGTPYVQAGKLYIATGTGGSSFNPDPTAIAPSSQGAYRDGGRDEGQTPTQGAWTTYPHPYTGAWFYGSQISTACSGKSVASMSIKLARSGATGGINGKVTPHLYLLSASSAGDSTPSLGDGPFNGAALAKGSSATIPLPSSWVTALAAGTAGGIAAYAGVGSDYLIFTGNCGQVSITFN